MSCSHCSITDDPIDRVKLVRDVATGLIYCDLCAATLRQIAWGVPTAAPLTAREGLN